MRFYTTTHQYYSSIDQRAREMCISASLSDAETESRMMNKNSKHILALTNTTP